MNAERQPKTIKENSPKNVPGKLVERFGKENLKNIIEYIEERGEEKIKNAREAPEIYLQSVDAFSATGLDAIHHVILGENLFKNPTDKELLSGAEKEMFYRHVRKNVVDGRHVAAYHIIRTGEKLGTAGQKRAIANFLRKELRSTANAGLVITRSGDTLGKLAALYRIFTGKPIEKLLEPLRENKHVQNKITKEIILNNLEVRINQGIKSKQYYSILDEIASYRILTAKKIDIIPGKGLVFPEAKTPPSK